MALPDERGGEGASRAGRATPRASFAAPVRVVCLVLLAAAASSCRVPEARELRTPRRDDFVVPTSPAPLRGCAPAASALPDGPLTLEDAIRVAMARNPDVHSAEASVESALATLEGARAQKRPSVSVDASVLAGDAPSSYLFKRIDARTFDRFTDFNDPGAFGNFELGATLRYNLWDGGRRRLGEYAAEAGANAERAAREAVRNELAESVVTTYLGAKAAEELLVADEASVKTVEAQVAETKAKVDRGVVLKSDELSLEVRLAQAEEDRIRTDVARRVALATLRRLLALPADATLVLAPVSLDETGLPASLDAALVEAYRQRPEVRGVRSRVRQARIEVERAKRAGLPSVDLQARWFGDDPGLRLSSNWWVSLAVSWDLYDGGRRDASLAGARAALARLEAQDQKTILDVALDVERSLLGLEEARARLDVAGKAVGASEETLDLVEKQYGSGSATITRYLEAEQERTRTRQRRIGARLDWNRAVVDVRRALGRLGLEAGR